MHGYLRMRIAQFLSVLRPWKHTIYLSRHGESTYPYPYPYPSPDPNPNPNPNLNPNPNPDLNPNPKQASRPTMSRRSLAATPA